MSTYRFRRDNLSRVLGSYYAPLASYTVTAYPRGAQVSGNQLGANVVNVRAGHGFPAGGNVKLIVLRYSGGTWSLVANSYRSVASSAAGTVTLSAATTLDVNDGDYLVNLSLDTGGVSPAYDASSIVISSDMAGAVAISQSRVTSASDGSYFYWAQNVSTIWELVRDASGAPVGVQVDAMRFGDMLGLPTTSVDNAIARFDGTDGSAIQDYTSGAPTIGDTGAVTIPSTLSVTGAVATGAQTVTGAITASGDISAAGGYRQTIDGWFVENVAASQTAVVMTRRSTSTPTTSQPTRWYAIRAGSVTGLMVFSNAARSAGTLTAEVYIDGVASGLTAVIDGTNTTFKATTQAKDTDTFAAGSFIDIRYTTDGTWSPTTADINASVEVET